MVTFFIQQLWLFTVVTKSRFTVAPAAALTVNCTVPVMSDDVVYASLTEGVAVKCRGLLQLVRSSN